MIVLWCKILSTLEFGLKKTVPNDSIGTNFPDQGECMITFIDSAKID